MIKENKMVSMTEAAEFLDKEETLGKEMRIFIKKFIKISPEKGKEMRKRIEGLGMMKINHEHASEIIDLLPEKAEDLAKIFNEVSLDEDETKKILDIVKEYI